MNPDLFRFKPPAAAPESDIESRIVREPPITDPETARVLAWAKYTATDTQSEAQSGGLQALYAVVRQKQEEEDVAAWELALSSAFFGMIGGALVLFAFVLGTHLRWF